MIMIDDRRGSRELVRYFSPGTATLTRLDYGDFSFWGNTWKGFSQIGIERKTLSDLLSSLISNRFTDVQLPGLLKAYTVSFLVIEAQYRPDPVTGELQEYRYQSHTRRTDWVSASRGKKKWLYKELESRLNTIRFQTPVQIAVTFNKVHTARFVATCDSYFSRPWDMHRSLKGLHYGAIPTYANFDDTNGARTRKLKMVSCLPNISWEKAQRILDHFGWSMQEIINASAKDWQKVPGIGVSGSQKLVELLK